MLKRIHVNQQNIRLNNGGKNLPVISVKTYKENIYGNEVTIDGPSKLLYRPEKPLNCGAKVWVETTSPVIIDGKITL